MLCLLCKKAHGYKQRKICVLVSRGFKALIKLRLDIFPNGVAVGANDHSALDGAVIDKPCLFNHVGIPLRKVRFYVRNLFYKIFLCHKKVL